MATPTFWPMLCTVYNIVPEFQLLKLRKAEVNEEKGIEVLLLEEKTLVIDSFIQDCSFIWLFLTLFVRGNILF